VEGNTIFACNRGALNIYDYDDQFWWEGSCPGYLAYWKQVHHPNRYWVVRNNTLVVGPKSWGNWYDGSKPDKRPAILINNEMDGAKMADGSIIDYQGGPHFIVDNLVVSPWNTAIEFHELSSARETYAKGNYCVGANLVSFTSDVPVDKHLWLWAEAEAAAPEHYAGNRMIADDIKQWPTYPDAGEIPPSPNYAWDKWPGEWNLFSPYAAAAGKGVSYDLVIWTPHKAIRANKLAVSGPAFKMTAVDPDEAMPHYKPTDG